jgi:uncharacterized membrane protein
VEIVNTALVIPVAATWGWAIGTVVCMLMMGVMMFAMMGHGRARDSRPRSWSDWSSGSRRETATEVLERRFAEGEISVEEYRERREILANAPGTQNGRHEDEALTTSGARERRQ